LAAMKKYSEESMTQISRLVAEDMSRSAESIRDRIKKYLKKISKKDITVIKKAAIVSFSLNLLFCRQILIILFIL